MARPKKTGLDYFPFDVDFFRDDKIFMFQAKAGKAAVTDLLKLYCEIYKDEGYYKKWSEEDELVFSGKNLMGVSDVKTLVNDAINVGLFSANLYKCYAILTSKGIQDRFFAAASKRKVVEVTKEYLLIDINSLPENYQKVIKYVPMEFAENKPQFAENKLWFPVSETPQSKVKESKVKESKEESFAFVVSFFKRLEKITAVLKTPNQNEIKMSHDLFEAYNDNVHVLNSAMDTFFDKTQEKNMWFLKASKKSKSSQIVRTFSTFCSKIDDIVQIGLNQKKEVEKDHAFEELLNEF